ncbi:MAG: radical SAM protein [Bacteroidetes bacterium]|uniref:Radical SAM protein n=1 Tax=Candidatus Gallipaludibacter merdavium TaxID=2840839 RepID=A0A9D9HRE1_9BACT|nr:radical SAM protein [Candidatus Gallipaludibacter merdavium]
MKTLFVSPSYICNEKCVFCPCYKEAKRYAPIPEVLLKSCIEEAFQKNRIEMVLISGGEPTLYKELPEIMKYIREMGLKIGILSNSLRFADEFFINSFINSVGGDFELTTAFHSHIAKEHDAITGIKGSFEKSLKGINNLIKANVHVTLKHVINALSYKKLPEFAQWVYLTFPDSVPWVICNMDLCGEALNNKSLTAVSFDESKPYLEKTLDIVTENHAKERHRNVSVFNTPLCCIDPYYWKFLQKYESEESMSALLLPSADKNIAPAIKYNLKGDGGANFIPCLECKVKSFCPGTWRQTAGHFGNKIFNPII